MGETNTLEWTPNFTLKWSDFQAENYNANAQPYYVLLDPNGGYEPLNGSASYHPDPKIFINWLNEGINKFQSL